MEQKSPAPKATSNPRYIIRQLIDLINNQIIPDGEEKLDASTQLLMVDIFDSLTMVTLLGFIHENFGVRIPDEEVIPENFKDFQSIADLVVSLQDSHQAVSDTVKEEQSPLVQAIKLVEAQGITSQKFHLPNGESLHTLNVEGEAETWLLLPGLGNPSSSWVTTLHALRDDYSAYAIDFNGFGLSSSRIERPNFTNHYEAIDQFIQHLDVDSLVIVGSSAGSMIGLEMARRYPEKVKAMVVTGFGLINNPEQWWERLQELSLDPQTFLNAAYHRPPELNNTLHSLIQDVMSRPAYWSFLEGGGLEEMKRIANDINVPTLFVSGESDQIIPKEAVEAACAAIPNAQIEWLARCGHFPPVEQPEELIYIIKNFLAKL